MLGLKSLRRVLVGEEKEVPIFNLHFEITGWQGPFRDYNEFKDVVDKLNYLRDSSTIAYKILEDGRLVPGSKEGLHTFHGELDLKGISRMLHFYSENGNLHYIYRGGENLFLAGIFKNNKDGINQKPRYTLQGLYATLADNKINTKIRRLEEELKEHKGYEFNSIARHKETRLKLLENAYRRMVSNQ